MGKRASTVVPNFSKADAESSFRYESIGAAADEVRAEAATIRQQLKDILGHTIAIGESMIKAKKLLRHGQFEHWVRAEFSWSERTARNYMSVARRFGPIRKLVSDLPIWTTAAFRLAAPSVPDEARRIAIRRAKAGETITVAVAKQIIGQARGERALRSAPAAKLRPRLAGTLQRYLDRWQDYELGELERQIEEFRTEVQRRIADGAANDGRASSANSREKRSSGLPPSAGNHWKN